ncbi:MAG: methylenetetrahydrofolate reductase C-terminal domain-containing protein [Elusimicrobia bacterium]|nr:methylenetetrahydrofolate reductase C-terminal domain-containing protein [Elusimicrobiota bacterium]
MLITQLKPKEELIVKLEAPIFIFKCIGCKEVYFPAIEIDSFIKELNQNISGNVTLDYICNDDFASNYIKKHIEEITNSKSILVFSCGVGVQTIAKLLEEKIVLTGCDTLYLNGFQGVTVQPNNCGQCGECYLNSNGGICPITACSKNLLNGSCGGAKNGKCEVSKEMDCGWERIYRKLEKVQDTQRISKSIRVRDYFKLI